MNAQNDLTIALCKIGLKAESIRKSYVEKSDDSEIMNSINAVYGTTYKKFYDLCLKALSDRPLNEKDIQ